MVLSDGHRDATMARRVRREHNLSLAAVAKAANIDRAALSRIERLRENPTEAVKRRIADALGLDPVDVTRRLT